MAENKILPGSTEKLGAIYDGKGVNFALFSENATKVELCLFDENENETRIELPNRSEDGIWSGYLPDAKPGMRYWFPVDDKPIVLFLDELNRARPEILQTVMDLTLNRKLAGKALPKGSRIIAAVNDGEEYQLTDLDPALVSRFNIYEFKPSVEEWLNWATANKLDSRVINFIQNNPTWLDGDEGANQKHEYQGLNKTADRRAWERVSDIMLKVESIKDIHKRIIAGIVGAAAAAAFILVTEHLADGLHRHTSLQRNEAGQVSTP